jgi:hypothetical protein
MGTRSFIARSSRFAVHLIARARQCCCRIQAVNAKGNSQKYTDNNAEAKSRFHLFHFFRTLIVSWAMAASDGASHRNVFQVRIRQVSRISAGPPHVGREANQI